MPDEPPPLYRVDTPDSEVRLRPQGSPLQLNTGDLTGLRAQILDNATTLFLLTNGPRTIIPQDFRISTIKQPPGDREDSGKHYAFISFRHPNYRHLHILALYINGPAADTTEEALRGLLHKMEQLMGQKWRKAIQNESVVRHEVFYMGD